MNKSILGIAVAGVLVSSLSAQAEMISSQPFSFGYGCTSKDGNSYAIWDTTEDDDQNTNITIGDFTFSPAVTNGEQWGFSSQGPIFPNRDLNNGSGNLCGRTTDFSVTIVGSWGGATPADAAPNPNYQIRLNISSLRIWAASYTPLQGDHEHIAFTEATSGHTATSTYMDLPTSTDNTGLNLEDNYLQLTWDPSDYYTGGTNFTRAFGVISDDIRPIDGFEVFGTIDMSYTAVPEPSTLVLLFAAAGVALLACRSRRRKRILA